MTTSPDIDKTRIPSHVAIIMDGNGRWAQARGLDRCQGHVEGVNTVRRITEEASELGIRFLTLYTFSTENWNRPKDEVDALMNLIVVAIERETPDLIKNNVRLTSIGDLERMPEFARQRLGKCMADTAHCTGLTLVLALSYSSRWEIVRAIRSLAAKAVAGDIAPDDIDENMVAGALATAGIPDPDLLIRTGGDMRISNFLLFQIAYTELAVTSTFWPDYSRLDFRQHIIDFQCRQRRFGLTGEQICENNHLPH
ncbi:MAG: isoprenyl transferase [Muribaculaceae bacterium]|nr:isoprenyl transferase [Muribaculaceae bacterium]MDE6135322.1 isoprenyl transferase [Muribaculaceae bacterium]